MSRRMFERRQILAGLGATAFAPRSALALRPQQRAVITSFQPDIIDVIAGQSNEIYGVAFNSALDIGVSNFFQMFSGNEGTANSIGNGGANDPLDNPDPSGINTPAIGNAVHFYRDWFLPAYGPKRVLFLPCAYGGTALTINGSGTWGVTTATGGPSIGTLTTSALSRIALARRLWPTARLIWRMELIEGDFDGYGNVFQPTLLSHYRGAYLDWMLYIRAKLAELGYANFPIIIGRPNNYALTNNINDGSGNSWYYPNMIAADIIVRGLATCLPNVGIADSVAPTSATWQSTSLIHFDAAGQRMMAGRYFSAYRQAISNSTFTTSPAWDQLDYLQSSLGYSGYNFLISAGPPVTISGDSSSNWKSARATCPSLPSSSAMLYAEIVASAAAVSGSMMCGLLNQACDLAYYLGGSTPNVVMPDYSWASYWGGQNGLLANGSSGTWTLGSTLSCPNFVAGDVIQIALNRATGKAWIGRNGTWLNSGNPSSGANPWISGIPQSDMVFLGCSIYSGAGNSFYINGKPSQLTYSPPSGFVSWGV